MDGLSAADTLASAHFDIDRLALLAVNAYYHAAFKTGSYPTISCDKVRAMHLRRAL